MAVFGHTYGPSCLLNDEPSSHVQRTREYSDSPPKLRAQFFYSSALPIDDPLSSAPPPSNSSTASLSKLPPLPFSVLDNRALEEAWQLIQSSEAENKELYGSRTPTSADERSSQTRVRQFTSKVKTEIQGIENAYGKEPGEVSEDATFKTQLRTEKKRIKG